MSVSRHPTKLESHRCSGILHLASALILDMVLAVGNEKSGPLVVTKYLWSMSELAIDVTHAFTCKNSECSKRC